MDIDVADLLDAAADRLLVHGWTRGEGGPEAGPNCTVGALWWATKDLGAEGTTIDRMDLPWRELRRVAEAALSETLGHRGVISWNDTTATEDDVHDLLRNTAKRLREV